MSSDPLKEARRLQEHGFLVEPQAPLAEVQPTVEVPPPSLADLWDSELGSILDPNPPMIRLASAGMGRALDRQLGGGLSPGQTVALVAFGAGQFKTTFLHQLADGLASASARAWIQAPIDGGTPVVIPVVFVSEMTTRDLSLRSLARQAGVEGYILRDPRGEAGRRPLGNGRTVGSAALERATALAGDFKAAAGFITPMDRRTRVSLPYIEATVRQVRAAWEGAGAEAAAVVVVVDPIHRILDPTRAEVEALGAALQGLMDMAQRTGAVVFFSSDTTKQAAGSRAEVGSLKTGEQLAAAAEAAFRGSYQLLHMADVALGLITLGVEDAGLSEEDRARFLAQPEGTLFAEVVNAKSRWDRSGQRAPYWVDPASFRFRVAEVPRALARNPLEERPLKERAFAFVDAHPGSSQNMVRKNLGARYQDAHEALQELLREGRLVNEGSSSEWKLHTRKRPHGPRAEQPREQPPEPVEDPWLFPGGPPLGGHPPRGTTVSGSGGQLKEVVPPEGWADPGSLWEGGPVEFETKAGAFA